MIHAFQLVHVGFTKTKLEALLVDSNYLYLIEKQWAFCNKRSHGTKSAILEGKLIIIPALGH